MQPSDSAASAVAETRDDNLHQVTRAGAAPAVDGAKPFVARLRSSAAANNNNTGGSNNTNTNTNTDPSGWRLTGFALDVPVLRDPRVRAALGSRGPTFARDSITYETYFQAGPGGDAATGRIEAAVAFSRECEGPPGCVHGGALATALDSLLGFTSVRLAGTGHVTLQLDTSYEKFVPLGSTVLGRARIDKRDGRKVFLSGELVSGDGDDAVVHVKATALFYCTTPDQSASYDQLVQLLGPESGVTAEQVLEGIARRKKKTGLDGRLIATGNKKAAAGEGSSSSSGGGGGGSSASNASGRGSKHNAVDEWKYWLDAARAARDVEEGSAAVETLDDAKQRARL